MAIVSNGIQQAEMTINISDLSVISDIRRLLKHVKGVDSITVRRKKSELDLSLECVDSGKVVSVGDVENLMQFLHS